jgi:hypothetical protein
MTTILTQSMPLIGLIVLGFAAKQLGVIRLEDRHALVRVIFNLTLPAVVFVSLSRAQIAPRTLAMIAAIGAVLPILIHFAAERAAKALKLDRATSGVLVLSTLASSIMIFTAPFVLTIYGQSGLGTVAAFDLGNSTVGSSYAYYVASRYADDANWSPRAALRRIMASPMLWANVLAVLCNVSRFSPPQTASRILESLAAANGPLSMMMLGSFMDIKIRAWRPIVAACALRMGVGWALGQLLLMFTGLRGLERAVVSVASASPVGLMPLLYASMLGLNVELAAATLSFSVLVGVASTPLLLWLYG